MDYIGDKIGDKIRYFMKRRGLTFEALAEKAGVSRKTVELAISDPGSRTLETLSKIAHALGVPISYLVDPAPLFLPETQSSYKEIQIYINEPVLDILSTRAKELGISCSDYIDSVLTQAVSMYRVMCGNCDGVFWVEPEEEWQCCPYCGSKEEEMIDEPYIE